jgi:hypothetical protein
MMKDWEKRPSATVKAFYVLFFRDRWFVYHRAEAFEFETRKEAEECARGMALAASPSVIYLRTEEGKLERLDTYW